MNVAEENIKFQSVCSGGGYTWVWRTISGKIPRDIRDSPLTVCSVEKDEKILLTCWEGNKTCWKKEEIAYLWGRPIPHPMRSPWVNNFNSYLTETCTLSTFLLLPTFICWSLPLFAERSQTMKGLKGEGTGSLKDSGDNSFLSSRMPLGKTHIISSAGMLWNFLLWTFRWLFFPWPN